MRFDATIEATKTRFKFMIMASFRFFKGRKRGSVARLLRRLKGMLLDGTVLLSRATVGAGIAYAVFAGPCNLDHLHAQQAPTTQQTISPYTAGLNRTEEEKAIIFLQVLDVPDTRVAEILGIPAYNVPRRSERALQALRRKITASLGLPENASLDELGIDNEEVATVMAAEIWDGLSPVKSTGGVDLTTLLEDASSNVKVFGLSTNEHKVMPLVAVIPGKVIRPGTAVSLSVPVVLSPDKDGVQRMVVSEARHLANRSDGGAVYILKSFCLDEEAGAPTLANATFRFVKQDQTILDKQMRDMIKNSNDDILQNAIWDLRRRK